MNPIAHTPRRALVTGASGFIGSSLVRLLLDEGVAVRALVMPGDAAPNLAPMRDRVEIAAGDLLSRPALAAAMAGCDTVFHLAAIYAIWLPVPRRMFDVNVGGTRNVMEAALDAGVARVVHTSSIAAIGTGPGGAPADEACHFDRWDDASDYVLSKYVSELEVHRYVAAGLPAVIVNPAFPFGAGDVAPTPTGEIIRQLLRRAPFRLPGSFNAVGVRDVARGHWLAALRGQVGRRYILGGHNMSYDELCRRVARIADVPVPRFAVSRRHAVALGRLGDTLANRLLRRPPLLAEMTVRYAIGRELTYDVSRARTELGYEPGPIDAHIREAVDWFRRA